jgi:hypothetical protein
MRGYDVDERIVYGTGGVVLQMAAETDLELQGVQSVVHNMEGRWIQTYAATVSVKAIVLSHQVTSKKVIYN